MWIIALICLCLLSIATYFFIIQPLIPLLLLKVKLGDKAILMFYPLFGFIGLFMKSIKTKNDAMETINAALRKNPKAKMILSNFLHKPCIMLTGAEYLKDTFTEHQHYEKMNPFMINSFIQTGLVLSEGDRWKRQRTFLGQAFTFEKLKSRVQMMNQVVEEIAVKDSKTNLNEFMSKITGEIVINSFFGELAQGLKLEGKDAQVALIELTADINLIQFENPFILIKSLIFKERMWDILPSKKEKDIVRRVNDVRTKVKEIIQRRIEQLRENPIQDQDKMVFLDLYVTEYIRQQRQQQQLIDIDEILHQFITLFFAGTDTTATTCGTCLYYLAQYPEIQTEILEEIENLVGQDEIKEYHLNKLVKINALIKEVLRFKNPAFATIFRIVKNDMQLQDCRLKKGWTLVQMLNASSIQENYFNNATEFNYKRWLNKNDIIKNDNGFVYIPFSAGPRNCIGQHMAMMEAKIIIALIVRKYQIILNPEVKQLKFGIKFLQCVEPDNCLLFEKRF